MSPADKLLIGLGLLGACALGILIGMPEPHEIQPSNLGSTSCTTDLR
jgi:hypothetical protein